MFLSGFFLLKKNIWEKGRFFDKNHGLTPLQNVDFFDFARISLFGSKKHSLLSRIKTNVSFWHFWLKKKHIRKRLIVWEKPWTNPVAKCRFFDFATTSLFRSKNDSFLSRISKTFFFGQKKTYKKKVDFLRKTMD